MVLPLVIFSTRRSKLISYSRRPTWTSSERIPSTRMERPERMARTRRWRRCLWVLNRKMSPFVLDGPAGAGMVSRQAGIGGAGSEGGELWLAACSSVRCVKSARVCAVSSADAARVCCWMRLLLCSLLEVLLWLPVRATELKAGLVRN